MTTTPPPQDESDGPEAPTQAIDLGSAASRVRRIVANTTIYALGEIGLGLLSAVLLPILTVYLSTAELGIWSQSMALFTGLATLCNPALHGAVTRYYFEHEAEPERLKRFTGTVLSFLLSWTVLVCGTLMLIGPWLFEAVFADLPFWPYGAFVVAMVALQVTGVVPRAIWTAAERSRPFVAVALAGSAINVLGTLGLVVLAGLGVAGMFWGRTLSLLVLAVPLLVYCLRTYGLAWNRSDISQALRFSLPLVPHLLAHWVLGMSDRYLIQDMYADLSNMPPDLAFFISDDPTANPGNQAAGIYEAAYAFIGIVNMVAVSMNRAWVPSFTRAYEQPGERPFIARTISWFVLAIGAISAAMAILSPTIIRGIFDEKFAFAAEFAPVIAIGGLFQGGYYIYVAGLFYFKDNRILPLVTIVSAIVNVALNILWIPEYGLVGAAWATLVGYAILFFGMRWACRRLTILPVERLRVGTMLVIFLVAAYLGSTLDGAFDSLWLELAAKLGLCAAAALALWITGAFKRDAPSQHH